MIKHKNLPKLKKGAWYVRVRGSYLPVTVQGWLMHVLLLCGCVAIILESYNDPRGSAVVSTSMLLQLVGLGAVFTLVASKKA